MRRAALAVAAAGAVAAVWQTQGDGLLYAVVFGAYRAADWWLAVWLREQREAKP